MKNEPVFKSYLVRAVYDWCCDSGNTPYMECFVNEYTQVPKQFVQNNKIVLNISLQACQYLQIDNEWVSFKARFGGEPFDVMIPIGHVTAIFAREEPANGLGFQHEPYEPTSPINNPLKSHDPLLSDEESNAPIARKGHLKLTRGGKNKK